MQTNKLEKTKKYLEQRNEVQGGESELPKLESDVPMPGPFMKTGWSKLIRSMKVGDSFVTDKPMSNLYIYGRREGYKLASRAIPQTNLRRVWRIE